METIYTAWRALGRDGEVGGLGSDDGGWSVVFDVSLMEATLEETAAFELELVEDFFNDCYKS